MPSPATLKPNLQCSNCGEYSVRPRRRSTSGNHWCSAQECQNAKARHYAQVSRNAAREAKRAILDDAPQRVALDFLRAAMAPRVRCSECGVNEAIDGWPHFNRDGSGGCFGTGRGELLFTKELNREFLNTAMPTRTYDEES